MNGHLNGARMADDSSRGRVVARPSSIQDEDVGPKGSGSHAQAHRSTEEDGRQCWGLDWRRHKRARNQTSKSSVYYCCTALHSTTVLALPAAFIRYHLRRAERSSSP